MNLLLIGMGCLLYHFGFGCLGVVLVFAGAVRAAVSLLVELLS